MSETHFRKLSDVISELSLPKQPQKFAETQIYQNWKNSAGELVATNTASLVIKKDVLHVVVKAPNWAHVVLNNQHTILKQLHNAGYKQLVDLDIRVSVPKPPKKIQSSAPKVPQRTVNTELRKLFSTFAKNATNPKVKETFLRMSKTNPNE